MSEDSSDMKESSQGRRWRVPVSTDLRLPLEWFCMWHQVERVIWKAILPFEGNSDTSYIHGSRVRTHTTRRESVVFLGSLRRALYSFAVNKVVIC